jgi:hypothetical protein
MLEGSVHRSANHVCVNAQLSDAQNDAHLSAERFDRDAGDLFGGHDKTQRVAQAQYLTGHRRNRDLKVSTLVFARLVCARSCTAKTASRQVMCRDLAGEPCLA